MVDDKNYQLVGLGDPHGNLTHAARFKNITGC